MQSSANHTEAKRGKNSLANVLGKRFLLELGSLWFNCVKGTEAATPTCTDRATEVKIVLSPSGLPRTS